MYICISAKGFFFVVFCKHSDRVQGGFERDRCRRLSAILFFVFFFFLNLYKYTTYRMYVRNELMSTGK